MVLKLDIEKDSAKAEKYYGEILRHNDFSKIVDGWKTTAVISANDYYNGNYVLAVAENGNFQKALDYAVEYVDNDYSLNNPLRILIYSYLTAQMTTEKDLIETELNKIPENGYLTIDREYLNNLAN